MKKILLIASLLLSFSPLSLAQDDIVNPEQMQSQFKDYYNQLIEQERHYNETVFEMKSDFANTQAARKKQLLDELKGLYSGLSFMDRVENKTKLSKIRTLREDFIKEQKQKRDIFKNTIFNKRKNFENERLKRKAEFEIKLRKWRATIQDQL